MSNYKNKNRINSNGSQSEIPSCKLIGDRCEVGGYQSFCLYKDKVVLTGNYIGKFNYIKNFLKDHINECNSMTDIGASNGLISFIGYETGYSTIYALDHDIEYINLINAMITFLNINNVITQCYSFGQEHIKTDIVIAGALIHWIYSCTATYGNFDDIIKIFKNLVDKYLIIEWVDLVDDAIKSFKHISFNKHIISEDYNETNFVNSLNNYFTSVNKVFDVTNTRRLYLCTV